MSGVSGYTYLERKCRAIEHMMPRVKLYKGRGIVRAGLKGKLSQARSHSYQGVLKVAFMVETKSFESDWSVGKSLIGKLNVAARVLSKTSRARSIALLGNISVLATSEAVCSEGAGKPVTARVQACGSAAGSIGLGVGRNVTGSVSAQANTKGVAITTSPAILKGHAKASTFGGGRLTILGKFNYVYGRLTTRSAAYGSICKSSANAFRAHMHSSATAAGKASVETGNSVKGAISTLSNATASITRARRGVIEDYVGHSISEYTNMTIRRGAYIEVANG